MRDHPNSEGKGTNVECIGKHLEGDMQNKREGACNDPNGDCADWEEDNKGRRCHDTVG